jgi:uncharacterized membrane protein
VELAASAHSRESTSVSEEPEVPEHVSLNIDAIRSVREKAGRSLRSDQRAIEAFTHFVGQPRSLYTLITTVALWIAYNIAAPRLQRAPFDPSPFFFLQGAIAFYAAIMATTILVTQNRQRKDEERNAHLELQVNLLAEQRTGKIVALLEELRRDLPNVRDRVDPVADALQQQVLPTAVVSAIEHTMNSPLAEERVAEERAELADEPLNPDSEHRP